MNPKTILEVAIIGCSMRPLLPHGSMAMVSPCKAAELRVGDIGLFRSRKVLVVHRVVAVQGGSDDLMIAERGDWAATRRWRPASHVVGRVVAVRLRRGQLELDRPLLKRILAFSGLGMSLADAPAVVRRVAIPSIGVILTVVGAFARIAPVGAFSKDNRRHAPYPAQTDPQPGSRSSCE